MLVEIDSASERAAVRETESELVNLRAQMTRAESLRARKLLSEADVDELRGKLGMAEARLEAVRSQRDKRTLRAPFSGVVGLRNIDLGAYVDSGTVLTTLDDLNTVELEFKIPERYFSAVKIGQSISAASTAFPQRKFSGVVREVDTRIEATTRAFRVRAELPNPDAVLPEGLFMSVSLVVAGKVRRRQGREATPPESRNPIGGSDVSVLRTQRKQLESWTFRLSAPRTGVSAGGRLSGAYPRRNVDHPARRGDQIAVSYTHLDQ